MSSIYKDKHTSVGPSSFFIMINPRLFLMIPVLRLMIPDSMFVTGKSFILVHRKHCLLICLNLVEKKVQLICFVDADHAGSKETRRSHTGVLIFVNRAPILWFSKRQITVETSTFGSEIIVLRISVELVEGLRYKLRMLGVPIDGPCDSFCDNNSVN